MTSLSSSQNDVYYVYYIIYMVHSTSQVTQNRESSDVRLLRHDAVHVKGRHDHRTLNSTAAVENADVERSVVS